MTLNLTPLEELEATTERDSSRRTTDAPQLDEDIFEAAPAAPEDIEVDEHTLADSAPLVTPEEFLGGAEIPPTELEARHNRIEAAIGESVSVRGHRGNEIIAAMRDGVLTKVSVGFWRARVKNTAEELGLDPDYPRKCSAGWELSC